MSKPMTAAEVAKQLEAAGIDLGTWGEAGGGQPRTPEFARQMAKRLQDLVAVLEEAKAAKQGEVVQLQEKLHRLKYGGGH